MSQTEWLWSPQPPLALPVKSISAGYPVNRLFFIGRNYLAHALEMGAGAVDKAATQPFYFTKSPSSLVMSGVTVPYPLATNNYHHEIELVVALGGGGVELSVSEAEKLVYGYACGLDMTRRDLQHTAKSKGLPWDTAKDCEQSAVVSEIVPMGNLGILRQGAIRLEVNGEVRQSADLSQLIWDIPEVIADLSRYYHLQAGDLIFTGTPEGVGPVRAGDVLTGMIEGVGSIRLCIAASN